MLEIERDPLIHIAEEKFNRLGIDGILLDLDDTLIFTSEIFRKKMADYVEQVCEETTLDKTLFTQELSNANDNEYHRSGVRPNKWNIIVSELAKRHQNEKEAILGNLPILKMIYRTMPRMRPGALISLKIFQEIGRKTVQITHGNVDWTHWKNDQLGLWNYFDGLVIADEKGKKGPEHWLEGANIIGVSPSRCLAVGDNLKGDVVAAASVGMKTALIPSPWSVYCEGEVPAETIRINQVFDLLSS